MGDDALDLHWLPLGAGGRSVRLNGRVFEALSAARDRRPRRDLYHAALTAHHDGSDWAIEVAPASDHHGAVATGDVGRRGAGRLRIFRYEVRCWRGGVIPDLAEAVGPPQRLSTDPQAVAHALGRVRAVPTPVWGRDELRAGEMWTSNSVVAWVLAGVDLAADVALPNRGRAPGWDAGLRVAAQPGTIEVWP
jgi:hypothetical protein